MLLCIQMLTAMPEIWLQSRYLHYQASPIPVLFKNVFHYLWLVNEEPVWDFKSQRGTQVEVSSRVRRRGRREREGERMRKEEEEGEGEREIDSVWAFTMSRSPGELPWGYWWSRSNQDKTKTVGNGTCDWAVGSTDSLLKKKSSVSAQKQDQELVIPMGSSCLYLGAGAGIEKTEVTLQEAVFEIPCGVE